MKRALSLLVLSLPMVANAWTMEGVDMDAVPWAELCPNVEAVVLTTGAGTCATVHPASHRHAKWDGFDMGVKEPTLNCRKLEREYERFTSPRPGATETTKPRDRWGTCIGAFSRALKLRAKEPARFSEPLDAWRQRYFGGHIHREG